MGNLSYLCYNVFVYAHRNNRFIIKSFTTMFFTGINATYEIYMLLYSSVIFWTYSLRRVLTSSQKRTHKRVKKFCCLQISDKNNYSGKLKLHNNHLSSKVILAVAFTDPQTNDAFVKKIKNL